MVGSIPVVAVKQPPLPDNFSNTHKLTTRSNGWLVNNKCLLANTDKNLYQASVQQYLKHYQLMDKGIKYPLLVKVVVNM